MLIVDAHCHASLAWFEPVEALIAQMDAHGVEHAVLVQIRGQYDNDYQFECVERFPSRLVSVVAVDRTEAEPVRRLSELKARGARGIRLWASSLDVAGRRLWNAAADLNLPVSCNGSAAEFASTGFSELVQSLPTLPVIIEHLGASTNRDRGGVIDDMRREVLALARFPNAYMKFHGLGEFAARAMPVAEPFPFERPIPPRLQEAYDAFGPSRLIWGSNYPPVSQLEGYGNALALPMREFANLADEERSMMFGLNAARLYRI